jgi:hypothetical protein
VLFLIVFGHAEPPASRRTALAAGSAPGVRVASGCTRSTWQLRHADQLATTSNAGAFLLILWVYYTNCSSDRRRDRHPTIWRMRRAQRVQLG